jgi:hypothetical protein
VGDGSSCPSTSHVMLACSSRNSLS